MTANIATFQDMLKEQLNPKIEDQINWVDVLLEDSLNKDWINREGIEIDMKNNKFLITSLDWGLTAYSGSETASLIASDIWLDQMYVQPKYVRASFILGHAAVQVTVKDQASLEKGVALYGMEIRRAMLRQKGRILRWDGRGIVWVLPAWVVTSASITVSAKAVGTIASQNHYGLWALQVFQAWQNVEFGTETAFAAGTQITGTILTVDSDTQITLTASVTVWAASWDNNRGGTNADTWYVRLSGEYGNAAMGLMGLIDDGTIVPTLTTIQNKTRSTTPYMKSYVSDKANASTIIKDFRDMYSAVTKYNKNVKYFLVSEDVYAKYTDSITITNQSNPWNAQYLSKLWTGHTGLAFAYGSSPVPIIMDSLLPYGFAYLVDSDQLFCADLFKDAYVEDGVMTRVTGTTNYETARAAYYNFGTYSSRKLWGVIHYQSV
jgi:hypothetical protein